MKKLVIGLLALGSISVFAAQTNGTLENITASVLADVETAYGVKCESSMSSETWIPAIDKILTMKAACGSQISVKANLMLISKSGLIENADFKLVKVEVKLK